MLKRTDTAARKGIESLTGRVLFGLFVRVYEEWRPQLKQIAEKQTVDE
jgi:GTPase Era involved in 16S rRNA processing